MPLASRASHASVSRTQCHKLKNVAMCKASRTSLFSQCLRQQLHVVIHYLLAALHLLLQRYDVIVELVGKLLPDLER